MSLDPNKNVCGRFRIEGNQFIPIPPEGRAGPNTLSVVTDASAQSNFAVFDPAQAQNIVLAALKALAVPQALPGSSLQGPFVVAFGSLLGQPAGSVVPTTVTPGAGGNP